jgi:hypothetical protein
MSSGLAFGYNDWREFVGGAIEVVGLAKGVRPGAIDWRIVLGRVLFPKTWSVPPPTFMDEGIGIPELGSPFAFSIVSRLAVIVSR